jgi:hypothetical protein
MPYLQYRASSCTSGDTFLINSLLNDDSRNRIGAKPVDYTGEGEERMGGENVDHKGDSSYFDVSRVPISLLRLTFV